MRYLLLKALISGAIVAAISEVSKRFPGFGGLISSLPLVAVLGMIWLWRDTHDTAKMAALSEGTFWYVLPSLPMFLVMPALLRRGLPFWPTLATGCGLTIFLYVLMTWLGRKAGLFS